MAERCLGQEAALCMDSRIARCQPKANLDKGTAAKSSRQHTFQKQEMDIGGGSTDNFNSHLY